MFGLASKVDKGKSKPKTEESIASIEIKKAKIKYNCKKKKEKINNTLLEIIFKKLRDASNEKN